ncbi:MAG: cell division protein FtsL [Acidobacteriota bacterium]
MRKPPQRLKINARLIRERDRKTTRDLLLLVLISSVLLLPLLLYVRQRMEFVRYGYRLEALTRELNQMEDRNRQLLVERASLRSLERVEKIARKNLGLVEQNRFEVVALNLEMASPGSRKVKP